MKFTINSKKYFSAATALTVAAGLFMAVPAFADTAVSTSADIGLPPIGMPMHGGHGAPGGQRGEGMPGGMQMKPGVIGTVSGVNGNSITVTGRTGFGPASASTTYTVDATNAMVYKNNATSSVSAIVVGDKVAVQGTVTGTSVAATQIRDGVMGHGGMGMMGGQGKEDGTDGRGPGATTTSPITGNGEPVVAGSVASINGSTLSITTKSNVTYTVDATNAKIVEGPSLVTLSSVKVGDTVLVQGMINGTSVTASSVIDQTVNVSNEQNNKGGNAPHGFFGGVASFFTHLFGF